MVPTLRQTDEGAPNPRYQGPPPFFQSPDPNPRAPHHHQQQYNMTYQQPFPQPYHQSHQQPYEHQGNPNFNGGPPQQPYYPQGPQGGFPFSGSWASDEHPYQQEHGHQKLDGPGHNGYQQYPRPSSSDRNRDRPQKRGREGGREN
jgi:hypothetical protein